MPAELRAYDADRWPSRSTWLQARTDWCHANGVDVLDMLRAAYHDRRRGAGVYCGCAICTGGDAA